MPHSQLETGPRRLPRIGGLISIFCLLLATLAAPATFGAQPVVVGGKNFTEQYILAELAKILLERHGLEVSLKTGVGSAVVRQSLVNAQIDLYYEYTGTAYTVYHQKSDRSVMTDPRKVYQWVKKADAEKGLIWLPRVKFNNTYILLMRKKQARNLGISTISDLAGHVRRKPNQLVFGVDAEFWERPDGFRPLMEHYRFEVPYHRIRRMIPGLIYIALRDGAVDVAMGFATDGRIDAFGFTGLKDDGSYFPVYNPAPTVLEKVLDRHPGIEEYLRPVAERLTTEEMRRLNYLVDIEHRDVSRVAGNWLQQQNGRE